MPYQKTTKMPGEAASKIGHLGIINDPFIKDLLSQFESRDNPTADERKAVVNSINIDPAKTCDFILAFDGSISTIPNSLAEHKKMSYINVATVCLDMRELRAANKPVVDPFFVKDLLKKNSDTIVAALPLSGFYLKGKTISESIRESIFVQISRAVDGQLLQTLKFLVFREWEPNYKVVEHFECIHPNCSADVILPKGLISFLCPKCHRPLTLVDYLGLMSEVNDESNSDAIAVSLMNLLEHLLVFYYLRKLPEYTDKKVLLIKDGPLMLRGQYSRLIDPMRSFIDFFYSKSQNISLVGVEKTGAFVDHLPILKDCLKEPGQLFIPNNEYILRYIKHSGRDDTLYGERVLYGAKAFFKADANSVYVLNIPTGSYKKDPALSDLKNIYEICSSIPEIKSAQFENSLAPVAAANRIASMSMYPSNAILERFTKDTIR